MSERYSIAQACALASPKPIGWGSDCGDIMSHDAPLTERQWLHLLHCGVIRTDDEVKAADEREAET